jgi:hypothetical protein
MEVFNVFQNIDVFIPRFLAKPLLGSAAVDDRNPFWEVLPSMTEISTAAILSYNHIIILQLEICCDAMQQL